jgi:hypothetical protein
VLHRLATGGHDIPDLAAAVVREMVVDPDDERIAYDRALWEQES